MDVVDKITNKYGDEPYRGNIKEEGKACLGEFKDLSYIVKAEMID